MGSAYAVKLDFKVPPKLDLVQKRVAAWTSRVAARFAQAKVEAANGPGVWAQRLVHPDMKVRSRTWTTDISLTVSNENGAATATSFALRVHNRDSGDAIDRKEDAAPSRPLLVIDIAETFKVEVDGILASPRAFPVRLLDEDVQLFSALLRSSRRRRPVLLISPSQNGRPLVDADYIAGQLLGLAHVAILDSDYVRRALALKLGAAHVPFEGALQLYWPTSGAAATGLRMRPGFEFAPEDEERNRRIAAYLLGLLGGISAERLGHDIVDVDRVTRMRLENEREDAILEARKRGNSDELLQLYEDENQQLSAAKAELEDEVRRLSSKCEAFQRALEERVSANPVVLTPEEDEGLSDDDNFEMLSTAIMELDKLDGPAKEQAVAILRQLKAAKGVVPKGPKFTKIPSVDPTAYEVDLTRMHRAYVGVDQKKLVVVGVSANHPGPKWFENQADRWKQCARKSEQAR